MQDRTRAGFALMVVIAIVLGILIGVRNIGVRQDEGLFTMSGIQDIQREPMSPDESTLGQSFQDMGQEPQGGRERYS